MLFTKSILSPPSKDDGLRISVMSRHTQNDGATPNPLIQPFDLHLPILAPSPKLIGDYYKRGLSWERFQECYLAEIQDENKSKLVSILATLALHFDITLLCIEAVGCRCHRRLLAKECTKYQPHLFLWHR